MFTIVNTVRRCLLLYFLVLLFRLGVVASYLMLSLFGILMPKWSMMRRKAAVGVLTGCDTSPVALDVENAVPISLLLP